MFGNKLIPFDTWQMENYNPQYSYEIDKSERTILPTREDANLKNNIRAHLGKELELRENNFNQTEFGENRMFNSIERLFKLASVTKEAGDIEDTTRGIGVGAFTGAGLGLLSLGALRSKGVGKLIGTAIQHPEYNKLLNDYANNVLKDTDLHKKLTRKFALTGATGGGIIGGVVGATTKNKKTEYVYSDPYFQKEGSEQHAFITDTGAEPLKGAQLPDDIHDAVMLANPSLKYLPIGSGISAMSLYSLAKKLKGKSIPIDNLMLNSLGGLFAGTIAKNELERHYSKPYMDKFSEQIDEKYLRKVSSDVVANEYISETGVQVIDPKVGPKSIESRIKYKKPYIELVPTVATAAGIIGGKLSGQGLPGMITGGTIGSFAGTLAEMALMEHEIEPYRQKFINSVKEKYGLNKNANIVGHALGSLNKLVNENPIADVVNYYGLTKDLGKMAGKPLWNWAKKKNIGGAANYMENLESQAKGTIDTFKENNPGAFNKLKKMDSAMDFAFNKVQLPIGMAQLGASLTGLGGSKEIDSAQKVMGNQSRLLKSIQPKYKGALGGMY